MDQFHFCEIHIVLVLPWAFQTIVEGFDTVHKDFC